MRLAIAASSLVTAGASSSYSSSSVKATDIDAIHMVQAKNHRMAIHNNRHYHQQKLESYTLQGPLGKQFSSRRRERRNQIHLQLLSFSSQLRNTRHDDDDDDTMIECDPSQENEGSLDPKTIRKADVGILSTAMNCPLGYECVEVSPKNMNTLHGGRCLLQNQNRRDDSSSTHELLDGFDWTATTSYCSPNDPTFYDSYESCDCAGFDYFLQEGTFTCVLYDEGHCWDENQTICGSLTVQRTFDVISGYESSEYCYSFQAPQSSTVCYTYTTAEYLPDDDGEGDGENSDAGYYDFGVGDCSISVDGITCNSCQVLPYGVPDPSFGGLLSYGCYDFDCTNTSAGIAGIDCLGSFVLNGVVPGFLPTLAPTTVEPSISPSSTPRTITPTIGPTLKPSLVPSLMPTEVPTVVPSTSPSSMPTIPSTNLRLPSPVATGEPFDLPNESLETPSPSPTTMFLSREPSREPTTNPTRLDLSSFPSLAPTTSAPTNMPSLRPTQSWEPTVAPSLDPTMTIRPSNAPSQSPSQSASPTTPSPTISTHPSSTPSLAPSTSLQPSAMPTGTPSILPTRAPSIVPTKEPTGFPTRVPTGIPTREPSLTPSLVPTMAPTTEPPTKRPAAVPLSLSPPPTMTTTVTPMDPRQGPMESTLPSSSPSLSLSPSMGPSSLPVSTTEALTIQPSNSLEDMDNPSINSPNGADAPPSSDTTSTLSRGRRRHGKCASTIVPAVVVGILTMTVVMLGWV